MASISLLLLLLLFVSSSNASLFRPNISSLELSVPPKTTTTVTTFFEVTRPIPLPSSATRCSSLLLRHDFANTYTKPPVTAPYSFPYHCPNSIPPSTIVLEWSASSKGRQFDRIFGVWLDGVELFRGCTAEPRPNTTVWTVRKDVTRYSSVFSRSSTLAVYLGNIVDSTYTGVYHVNISLHFYYSSPSTLHHNLVPGFGSPADLILPLSRPLPLNDGQWFLVENSTDVQWKQLSIPSNTYRAVLEVCVSYHSDDEFWYTNPPNDYLAENNITDLPGNGAFREVVVSIDNNVVGAVWPFTVIYTGGVNPLLWRPITGIGSFNLPSYDIEITPFLGKILDGKPHNFGFRVTNALDVWFVDANLHLWLDCKNEHVVSRLTQYKAPEFKFSVDSKFKGLDGRFDTKARRDVSMTGWVKSSHGKITTRFFQKLVFKNLMVFRSNSSVQVIKQSISADYATYAKNPSSGVYLEQVSRRFPLYLYTATTNQINHTYSMLSNISFGFNEKKFSGSQSGFAFNMLQNSQDAQGEMSVKGNLVTSGIGSTQQVYRYDGTDGCYFRNVSSSNYTILYDKSGDSCSTSFLFDSAYAFTRWLPYSSRRASLAF